MDRRDALKSLAALAGATGISMTPLTTHEASNVTMVILRVDGRLSRFGAENIKASWNEACQGTGLEGVKTVVVDSAIDIQIVRART